jgi:hypothetical protein
MGVYSSTIEGCIWGLALVAVVILGLWGSGLLHF